MTTTTPLISTGPIKGITSHHLDEDAGNQYRVNENSQPARLGLGLTMKRTRHTPEGQIIRKLKTVDQLIVKGRTVADVFRVLESAELNHYRSHQHYAVLKSEEAQRHT